MLNSSRSSINNSINLKIRANFKWYCRIPWTDWNVCNLIFSSVVTGNLDTIELRMVVSGNFSMIICSLLASVLLSVCRTVVIGTYLTVVVSGFDDNVDRLGVVSFWCCVVLETMLGFDDVDCPFVVVVNFGVDDAVEWNELTVDVTGEPNEKCGIVFWSILFSIISDSTISASSW